MNEKRLPIKMVLQKKDDIHNNNGGGDIKFFGEVTPELQEVISNKFNDLLDYYSDVFEKNDNISAIGKVTVKNEAIAKSHKPNDLCRKCPIVGGEALNELYIRVNKKSIEDTMELVKNPPSKRFKANMTAVLDIQPIKPNDKITPALKEAARNDFSSIKNRIKIKIFDFGDDYDNVQIWDYVNKELEGIGVSKNVEVINYGNDVNYIKAKVQTYEEIQKIASINGVKVIDFFQEYSTPNENYIQTDLEKILNEDFIESDISIGIIDGGISDYNLALKPYIVAREEYISEVYRNPNHATFIASTIQFGNLLNGIDCSANHRFKLVDIVAMPNSDPEYGPIDTVSEYELMEIIEDVMKKYSNTTKIWNLSLGLNKLCSETISDLGIFLDYIQDEYKVQIFVSSGNLEALPLRKWPPQDGMGEVDRLISPADSVRAITVGSVALFDSDDSIVKKNEPSPFSRRGPGANYIVKPDVVDYGGNISINRDIEALGVKGLNPLGDIVEGVGTSYSNPRTLQKFASIYEEMVEPDLLLAKGMLIHSARMNSRELLDEQPDNIKYYGFGLPSAEIQNILQCSDNEVTLVFKQRVFPGSHLEMYDFPYPKSLVKNNKYFGEIGMTLVYLPPLDKNYGNEYCRTNIDVSFGTYSYSADGKPKFKGQVPVETKWDEKYEESRVKNGFKWNPIKSYYRRFKNGIGVADGWKIRIDMTARSNTIVPPQEFVLIITIKAPRGSDIYSEIVTGLRERGYVTNNLETRYLVRQRQ